MVSPNSVISAKATVQPWWFAFAAQPLRNGYAKLQGRVALQYA